MRVPPVSRISPSLLVLLLLLLLLMLMRCRRLRHRLSCFRKELSRSSALSGSSVLMARCAASRQFRAPLRRLGIARIRLLLLLLLLLVVMLLKRTCQSIHTCAGAHRGMEARV